VTEQPHSPGLWPVPGDGVLARHGSLVLLSSLGDGQFVDVLLDLLEHCAASGGDGREFADAIADKLETAASAGGSAEPAVLAFGGTESGGLAVAVSGGAWADITTAHGTTRVEAGHPGMLLRCVLRTPVSGVTGGLSPADNGSASTDRFSRLDAGTVRAGGLSYYAAATGEGGAKPAPSSLAKPAASSLAKPAGKDRAAKAAARSQSPPEPVADQPAAESAAGQPPLETAPDQPGSDPSGAGLPAAGAEVPVAEPSVPLLPAAEQPGPLKHEPTAAWIPPQGDPEHGTELWTPDFAVQGDEGAALQPPAAAGPPEVTILPEPVEPLEPFESVLLFDPGSAGASADAGQREPLSQAGSIPPGTSSYVSQGPIIQGVYCSRGHFDDPEARYCAVCGISMNQQTLVPRPGERPPLGLLLLDDGSVFQLDTDYVVGREPSLDSSVAAGKARPLRVSDEAGIVSRVHARVHLDGWRVLVTDLGSANGTRILQPGQSGDQPLVPQVPIVLVTGSQVDVGGRGFRYESHRGR
jgi:FHA domain